LFRWTASSYLASLEWEIMRGRNLIAAVVLGSVIGLASAPVNAASLIEGFNDVESLFTNGWVRINHSSPQGAFGWVQNNPSLSGFEAQAGATDSTITANFESVQSPGGTISDWLLTPNLTFENGDEVSFYTRSIIISGEDEEGPFEFIAPDRLEVRLGQNGASTNIGTQATDVGDFSLLLKSINPDLTEDGYPLDWQQFSVVISGLSGPTSGRLAFRYFVTDGGEFGNNSNIIGIDTLQITPVPEPASLAMLGGLLAVGCMRRRRGH
jgi:hypothetical protein